MALLNQETRLSYNWETRPADSQELILRNTFRNACNKDRQFITLSTPSKVKQKQKRRISWSIEQLQQTKVLRQASKGKNLDQVAKIRNQVLSSVRRILDKQQSIKNASSTSPSDSRSVPLKKYKSSYSLAYLPNKTNMQKMENIPVISVQLTELDDNKGPVCELDIKRAKTEGSESNSNSKMLPQVTVALKDESKKGMFGHRRMCGGLKKLKSKDCEAQIIKNWYNDIIYDKLR